MSARKLLFPADFQLTRPSASHKPPPKDPRSVYDAWLASRELPGQPGHYLVPGAPRPLTLENARLALFITQASTLDFVCRPFPTLFRALMAVQSSSEYSLSSTPSEQLS
jgi:hypothetical protein